MILSGYKDKKQEGVPNIYHYIVNNIDCIDYPTYREAGLFIGSGAVESANRTVMQSSMKLSGMRWNVVSAQRMMALNCKDKSGLWESVVVPLVYEAYGLTR